MNLTSTQTEVRPGDDGLNVSNLRPGTNYKVCFINSYDLPESDYEIPERYCANYKLGYLIVKKKSNSKLKNNFADIAADYSRQYSSDEVITLPLVSL